MLTRVLRWSVMATLAIWRNVEIPLMFSALCLGQAAMLFWTDKSHPSFMNVLACTTVAMTMLALAIIWANRAVTSEGVMARTFMMFGIAVATFILTRPG